MCVKPLQGFRDVDGKVKLSTPLRAKSDGVGVVIPCGRCVQCRLERSRQWALRCMHEAQMHEKTSFITLTYNEESLPKDMSLRLSDWQNFAKYLRKEVGPFRYFHCGEYGDDSGRPHYHAAIFGIDFSEDRRFLKTTPRGDRLYTSATLERVWGKGFAPIGELTFESAAYVARYIMKKQTGPKAEEHYARVNVVTGEVYQLTPEYTTMSRGGRSGKGIGYGWFEKWKDQVYPLDLCVANGQEMKPPKYYDRLLEESDSAMLESVKERREAESRDYVEVELANKERHIAGKLAMNSRGSV